LIDTESVLAAWDEAAAELEESARVMREYSYETVAFGDVSNGDARVVDFRVSDNVRDQIALEADGLDLAARLVRDMREALAPA
jgi:hypothetical protein